LQEEDVDMGRLHGLALTTVAFGVLIAGDAQSQRQTSMGELEFRNSCAQCHGLSGKGDGPVASSLTTSPSDLTTLQKDNGGIFPVNRVYSLIDGRAAVGAHGTREMPIWGARYSGGMSEEVDPEGTEGPFSQMEIEMFVRMRILSLIEYISTLQTE
jgi:mono/diheme cytochrome c family protein